MRKYQRILLLLWVTLALSFMTVIAALRSQNSNPPTSKEKQQIDFESQFPIVDFTTQEPDDPEKLAKRRAKGKKHDRSPIPVYEYNEQNPSKIAYITSTLSWEANLTALPVGQSQVIVIGEVVDAQAYLSNDRTGVYSEFTISVDEVLKNTDSIQIAPGGTVIGERKGGRVRLQTGHITLSSTTWQGMPRIKRRYVLFLARDNQEQNFEILTGYELKEDRIRLLDNPPQHPITANEGKDKTAFLDKLRAAIASN